MLVLSRKVGERIWIGDEITITIVRMSGGAVRLGIEAPPDQPVIREELKARMEQAAAVKDEGSCAQAVGPRE